MKSGRSVGPDLRLEPSPALEMAVAKRAGKRSRATAPATCGKVGPSLRPHRRKDPTRSGRGKWIQSAARLSAPDTKMPHFFGLSTNNKEYLHDQRPPTRRISPTQRLPPVAHYLFLESNRAPGGQGHLPGSFLVKSMTDLQNKLGRPKDCRTRS